jgi:hypothetical protein
LRVQIRDLDDRIEGSEDYGDLVTAVVAMAVVRMFRGRDPQDPADFSAIFFSKSELDALMNGGAASGSDAFQVALGYESGTRPLNWWELNL